MAVEMQGTASRPAPAPPGAIEVAQHVGIALIVGLSVAGILLAFAAPLALAGSFGLASAVVPVGFGLVARRTEEPEAP